MKCKINQQLQSIVEVPTFMSIYTVYSGEYEVSKVRGARYSTQWFSNSEACRASFADVQ